MLLAYPKGKTLHHEEGARCSEEGGTWSLGKQRKREVRAEKRIQAWLWEELGLS